MSGARNDKNSGMWLGFGFVTGAGIGLCFDPRAIPFFAATGMIVTVLVSAYFR
ncbi:MAG: hypothetical protein KJ574_00880 [Nanoarchaeota archaeon]|nr:hypothetical protein [Nanoarchaeota archaeon]